MRSHEREGRGKQLINFHSRPIDLLTLDVIAQMCPSNVKNVPNIIPKCFCDETCWTGLLLKKIGGCTALNEGP